MTPWSELDPEEKRAKARRAAEILDGAGWLFDEAIATWTDAIVNSAAKDAEQREEAYRHIHSIQYLRTHLSGIAATMAIEDKQRELHATAKRGGPLEE
jgi:hypothetical protein